MEKIAELFLKIYPIEGVSVKRRILLHWVFWIMMFIGLWKTLMSPLAPISYNFITTSYLVILDIIFFYTITYRIIPLWAHYHKYKYIATITYILTLVLSLFVLFYIRVQFIFDNTLPQSSNVDFRYLKKFHNNYTYLFTSGSIFTSILEIFLTALPAFFIKLTRSLIKSISKKNKLKLIT